MCKVTDAQWMLVTTVSTMFTPHLHSPSVRRAHVYSVQIKLLCILKKMRSFHKRTLLPAQELASERLRLCPLVVVQLSSRLFFFFFLILFRELTVNIQLCWSDCGADTQQPAEGWSSEDLCESSYPCRRRSDSSLVLWKEVSR